MEKIGLHRPFSFDVKRPAGLEPERVAKCLARGSGDMDAAGQTISLHALGRIHGITPDVEADFMGAEHAGDYWPTNMDPYAQLQFSIESPAGSFSDLQHRQAHLSYCNCAVWPPFEYAASHHITVADSLDRFEPATNSKIIELREQETEELDGFFRR